MTFDATFEAARATFARSRSLRLSNETSEQEFTRGRAQYLVFLVRIEDSAAREYIRAMQERIVDMPGIELFPEHYWHMSVKGGGFQVIKRLLPDDVLREDVPRMANDARHLLSGQRGFEARLGPLAGFPEVMFIEVHDDGRIRELNALLAEGLPHVPRYPIDSGVFLPHVSIARFSSSDGLDLLKTLVADQDRGPGPTVIVRRIEFVKVWLSGSIPEFQTLATYSLG